MKPIYIILLALSISGCGQIGGSSKGESQQTESKTDVANAALESQLKSSTHKALVNAAGASNTTIYVRATGALRETMEGREKKKASQSSVWSMTFEEMYSSYSSFMFLFMGIGLLLIVRALRQLESTKTFRAMSGGLRGLASVASIGAEMLGDFTKGSSEWEAIKKYTDAIHHKKSKLQSDISDHHNNRKGFFS